MVTVIQQAPGNAATDVLGALNAVLQGIQANRDKGQEQQLKLLEILSKQPGAQLEPVAPDQLQQPNFLDYLVGAQPRTLTGAPAARFGGSALTVRPPVRVDINTLFGSPAVVPVPQTPGLGADTTSAGPTVAPASFLRSGPAPSVNTGPQTIPGEGGAMTEDVTRPPEPAPAPPPYKALSPSLVGPRPGPADVATRLQQAEQAVTYLQGKVKDNPTPQTQALLERATTERDALLAAAKAPPATGTAQTKPTWQTAQPSAEVQAAVTRASASTGVPVSHLLGLGAVESALDPGATGPMTRFGWQAKGILQLSPDTGKRLGNLQTDADFYDVGKNVATGALAWKEALQKAGGDPRVAYQKYYNPGASDADTNKVLLSIRRFEQGGPDTSQMVAGPGAPTPPTASSTPEQDKAYRDSLARQGQPGAPPAAPTAPVATPPSGTTAPAPATARPQAPAPVIPAWMQDVQQQQTNAPASPYVRIQGLGIVEKSVYDTALERLKATYPQGVLLDPVKGAGEVYTTLHKYITEERGLRKDFETHKKEALKEFGNLPEIRAATNPAQLAGTLEALAQKGASPEAMRQSRIQDTRAYFGALRRQYGEVPLDRVAQVEQGLLDSGVKPEVVQGLLKDYGITGQREALAISQKAPAEADAELQKLQTTGQEKVKQAGETAKAQGQARASEISEVSRGDRTFLLQALGQDGIKAEQWGALSAQQQATYLQKARDLEIAHTTTKNVQLKQANYEQAPLGEKARLYVTNTGEAAPSNMSAKAAADTGHRVMSTQNVDQLKALEQVRRYKNLMQTMLLGGNDDEQGTLTGKPGSHFPGILPEAANQNILQRGLTTLGLRKAQLAGKEVGEWAKTYEQIRTGLMGGIERGFGGERGRIPGNIELMEREMFPSTGLTGWLTTAPSASQAEKNFRIIEAVGQQRRDVLWGASVHPAQSEGVATPPTSQGPTQPAPPPGPAAAPLPQPPPAQGEAPAPTNLPPAAQYNGAALRDKRTGKVYTSDGTTWQEKP